ncbi:MAG: carboxypeptidase regulatory-like domain-containing protein [Candidatus Cloacimonetes bacterium]|nr:carboxypeptidase regulatory-like domain-containing protein [Candidatus Cloacimonadota bacterium]
MKKTGISIYLIFLAILLLCGSLLAESICYQWQQDIWKWSFSREVGTAGVITGSQSAGDRDELDIMVNGEDNIVIMEGEIIIVTLYFSDGYSNASALMWADMNFNGLLDEDIDFLVEEHEISDNSGDDEDPAPGVYQETISEGPNSIANVSMILSAEDGGGFDYAHVYVDQITSAYSISGTVSPSFSHIMVMAINDQGEWGVMTNPDGTYQNFVPQEGTYILLSLDTIGVTGGMYTPDFYMDVYVDGHLTGYDFTYIEPAAWVEGTVLDDSYNPMEDYGIHLSQQNMQNHTQTDSEGYYNMGAGEGWGYISMDEDYLYPDYLIPHEQLVYINNGETAVADFTVYQTDSTIEGTVYLDDIPAPGFLVNCDNIIGFTTSESDENGGYVLHVSSAGDLVGGYQVAIWDVPPFTYLLEFYENVMSGETGVDLYLYTVTGGLYGYVLDAVSGYPIPGAWIMVTDGDAWFGTGTDEDGSYILYLPNGIYDAYGNADGYNYQMFSDIMIADEMVELDFTLFPETAIDDKVLYSYPVLRSVECSPNPFNPETCISFELTREAVVTLQIYNIKGQLITTLLHDEMPAGYHEVNWSAAERASGLYLFRIKADKEQEIKKIILLK